MPSKGRSRRLGRPPGSDSAQTRPRIVAGALQRFAEVGYSLATNSEIAQAAGLTTGAIYHYFDSKQELYEAVAEETWRRCLETFEAAARNKRGIRAKLIAILDSAVALNRENPAMASFVVTAPVEVRRHPELAAALAAASQPIAQLFADLVRDAVENGELTDDLDPVDVANMIAAITSGLAMFATQSNPDDHAAATAVLERMMDGTLFAKTRGRVSRTVSAAS